VSIRSSTSPSGAGDYMSNNQHDNTQHDNNNQHDNTQHDKE
jgi:hypothetical protein